MKNLKSFLVFGLVALFIVACKSEEPKEDPLNSSESVAVSWVDSKQIDGFVGTGSSARLSGATLLHSSLTQGKGTKIIAISAGIMTTDATNCEVFITNDLEGTPLYTQAFTPTGLGWEYVKLTTPFDISSISGPLYIGYHLTTENSALGYVIGTKMNKDADWVAINGSWSHLSDVSNNLRYAHTALKAYLIGGDYSSYTQCDIELKDVVFDGYLQVGGENIISGTITNFGVKTLTGASVTFSNGRINITEDISTPLANGEPYRFTIKTTTPEGAAEENFTITVTPNGITDSQQADNTFQGTQTFYTNGFQRTILLEQFTGVACVNCPAGTRAIYALIANNTNRVAWVAHHVGFGTDIYTIDASKPYVWYFNDGGSTYAPAMMMDRTIMPSIEKNTPVYHPGYATKDLLNQQLSKPALVSVILNTTYDPSSRALSINVSGEFLAEMPNARLNIYLAQDSILGPQTGGGMGDKYVHNRTIRAVLSNSGTWGDVLTNSVGSQYNETYTYTIPATIGTSACVPEQMFVVAFISNYVSTSVAQSVVQNAAMKYIIE